MVNMLTIDIWANMIYTTENTYSSGFHLHIEGNSAWVND